MFTLVSNLTIARWDSRPIGFFWGFFGTGIEEKLSCWRCAIFSTSWTLQFGLKCLRVGARMVEQGFCMILQTSQTDVFFMITRMVHCWMLVANFSTRNESICQSNGGTSMLELATAKSPNFM